VDISEKTVSQVLKMPDGELNQRMLDACKKAGMDPKDMKKALGDAAGLKRLLRTLSHTELKAAVSLLKSSRAGKAIGFLLADLP